MKNNKLHVQAMHRTIDVNEKWYENKISDAENEILHIHKIVQIHDYNLIKQFNKW